MVSRPPPTLKRLNRVKSALAVSTLRNHDLNFEAMSDQQAPASTRTPIKPRSVKMESIRNNDEQIELSQATITEKLVRIRTDHAEEKETAQPLRAAIKVLRMIHRKVRSNRLRRRPASVFYFACAPDYPSRMLLNNRDLGNIDRQFVASTAQTSRNKPTGQRILSVRVIPLLPEE